MTSLKGSKGLLHSGDRSAEHRLNRVGYQGVFYRNDKVDVFEILLKPATDTVFEFVHVLEHDGAFAPFIESQNGVAAKVDHCSTQLAAYFDRQQVSIERFPLQRAGD